MTLPSRLRFGLFLAPFHHPTENPTLALERDLELIEWLDTLGYDEVWVGEHHSAGWETISTPEIFLAMAAARTKHIKLGTGVVSLPYHHPLIVADRMVLLDHLTRGRVLFGVGPGALVTDALMLGVEPARQRPMMEEALDAIVRLFTEAEPITVESDWFQMRDAMLQLRPFSLFLLFFLVVFLLLFVVFCLVGKHGFGVFSMGLFSGLRGAVDLAGQWQIAEEAAAEAGKTVSRQEWRLVLPVYLAESRQEALDDVREGSRRFIVEYQNAVLGRPIPEGSVIDAMADSGSWIIGTPDDCIVALERLSEISGGFGGLMLMFHEWASRDKLRRSYELLARYVMPHFQGALVGLDRSYERAKANRTSAQATVREAIELAHTRYETTRAT